MSNILRTLGIISIFVILFSMQIADALPAVTIQYPIAWETYNKYIVINASADMPIDEWYYEIVGGMPLTLFTPPTTATFSGLSSGAYSVSVFANASGDIGQNAVNIIIDVVEPTLSITYPTNGTTIYSNCSSVLTINGTSTDDFSLAAVTINDTAWTFSGDPYNWYFDNANVSCGTYDISIMSKDLADNNVSEQIYFTVATTVPVITVYYPSPATVLGDVTQLNVSADVLVDTWQYRIIPWGIGCPYITFTPNTTINITYLRGLGCFIYDTVLPFYISQISATNIAGTGYHWVSNAIDSVYPVISDLVPATTAYITSSSPSVMITGSVSDWWSGTNHTWVNDTRWVNIGTPYTIQFNNTNASIGYYTVLVSANDSAGNEISTPMSFYVAYTSPPIPVVPSSDIPLATRLLLSTIMASGGIISFVGFSLYGKRDLRQLTYGMVFLLIALTFAATIMTM